MKFNFFKNLFIFNKKKYIVFGLIILLNNLNGILFFKNNKVFASENISIEYFNQLPSTTYKIGTGDELKIILSRRIPELTNIYKVDVNGTIDLPYIFKIYVNGLTIEELTFLLEKRFKEYIKNPKIVVEVIKYRSVNVFIDGEVERPGFYRLGGTVVLNNSPVALNDQENSVDNNLDLGTGSETTNVFFPTLFDAIKSAGGITNDADLTDIVIKRKDSLTNNEKLQTKSLNFNALFFENDTSQNIRIYDGDIIKVKRSNIKVTEQISKAIKSNLNPRFINVYVSGRVELPGQIKLAKLSSLNDAIEVAGGAKVIRGAIFLTRYNFDGTVTRKKLSYKPNLKSGLKNNPYLIDGDIIRISKGTFGKSSEFLSDITKPFANAYGAYALFNIFND